MQKCIYMQKCICKNAYICKSAYNVKHGYSVRCRQAGYRKYFIGREEELKKITVLLSAETASNIALLAQRRTGKSSILYNLKEQDTGRVHVIFDAYGMSTKERFAKAYMTVVSDACAKTGDSTYGNTVRKMLATGQIG